jgi:carboxylesterase type B
MAWKRSSVRTRPGPPKHFKDVRLAADQKRAVLVSFHAGGFATGSGNAPGFDGAQLARFGDVVVVTVNHRLASFGYLHLADLGAPPEFAHAGVAGVMDLVASLEWVRDNIERFGGDPGNVMIFGQSGGGAKTSTVLAMPSGKGLFHRAAVQSGSSLRLTTPERGTKLAETLLAKLGISKSNIADLQKLSWQQILEAQSSLGLGLGGFGPIVEGNVLPHQRHARRERSAVGDPEILGSDAFAQQPSGLPCDPESLSSVNPYAMMSSTTRPPSGPVRRTSKP